MSQILSYKEKPESARLNVSNVCVCVCVCTCACVFDMKNL